MAHGERAQFKANRAVDLEYWGKRDSKEIRQPCKATKILTHRRERRKQNQTRTQDDEV